MYYPVAVPGGLFSIGDSHAAQGDSELCGTAIEMSLTGTFQLILHKKDKLSGSLAALNYPLLETQDEWVLHGFSFANYLEELGPTAQQDIGFHGRVVASHCGAMSGLQRCLCGEDCGGGRNHRRNELGECTYQSRVLGAAGSSRPSSPARANLKPRSRWPVL
jgi:hypothetical protein